MEEKFKEIIATFIKIPAQEIGPATPIDRNAVKSSIMLHRMYARLAEEGLAIGNYATIRVYGDLLRKTTTGAAAPDVAGQTEAAGQPEAVFPASVAAEAAGRGASGRMSMAAAIGIDIEEVAALPRAVDFRKDEFYTMNFTARETAYCILQPDPYASFAGLFAAKEAMVKADASIRDRSFHLLEISHSPEGKPLTPGFSISISHANGMAVAVAAPTGNALFPAPALTAPQAAPAAVKPVSWLAWMALLLSVAALLIALVH